MAENLASKDGRLVRGLIPLLEFSFSWYDGGHDGWAVGWTYGNLSGGGGGALLFLLLFKPGLVMNGDPSFPGDNTVFCTNIGREPSNKAVQ